MPSLQIERPEPERQVVRQSEIPPPGRLPMPKCFWDSVVRHLALLEDGEALQLRAPVGDASNSMKSSIATAAARGGVRVKIVIRGAEVYVWLVGVRDRKGYIPPRPPIQCEVCGKTIIRPRTGGSVQYTCSGTGTRKSDCQKIRHYARIHHVTIPEMVERIRVHREKMAARRQPPEAA